MNTEIAIHCASFNLILQWRKQPNSQPVAQKRFPYARKNICRAIHLHRPFSKLQKNSQRKKGCFQNKEALHGMVPARRNFLSQQLQSKCHETFWLRTAPQWQWRLAGSLDGEDAADWLCPNEINCLCGFWASVLLMAMARLVHAIEIMAILEGHATLHKTFRFAPTPAYSLQDFCLEKKPNANGIQTLFGVVFAEVTTGKISGNFFLSSLQPGNSFNDNNQCLKISLLWYCLPMNSAQRSPNVFRVLFDPNRPSFPTGCGFPLLQALSCLRVLPTTINTALSSHWDRYTSITTAWPTTTQYHEQHTINAIPKTQQDPELLLTQHHQHIPINNTPSTQHHKQHTIISNTPSTSHCQQHTTPRKTTQHHPHKTLYNRPCFPFLTFPSAPPQKGGHSIHIPNFQNTISTKASTQRCSNTALARNHKKTTPLSSFYLERFLDPRIFASQCPLARCKCFWVRQGKCMIWNWSSPFRFTQFQVRRQHQHVELEWIVSGGLCELSCKQTFEGRVWLMCSRKFCQDAEQAQLPAVCWWE